MSSKSRKSLKGTLTIKNILASLIIICLWWAFWLSGQALFMVDIPIFSDWLIGSGQQTNFIVLTTWTAVVCLIAFAVYHWLQRDYSFLRAKNKWDVLAYIVPLVLMVALIATTSEVFGVPVLIYICGMIVSVFCQDLLTTGFMQTSLSHKIGPILAAVVTCVVFYFGHFMITETLTIMGVITVIGFVLFSFLRYKRGNIYLVNVVHLSYSLLAALPIFGV